MTNLEKTKQMVTELKDKKAKDKETLNKAMTRLSELDKKGR